MMHAFSGGNPIGPAADPTSFTESSFNAELSARGDNPSSAVCSAAVSARKVSTRRPCPEQTDTSPGLGRDTSCGVATNSVFFSRNEKPARRSESTQRHKDILCWAVHSDFLSVAHLTQRTAPASATLPTGQSAHPRRER